MMALIKFVITTVQLECMEIPSQKVAYLNVPSLLVKSIMLFMEHLPMESSVNRFAPTPSMPLQVLGNVLSPVQQAFTSIQKS